MKRRKFLQLAGAAAAPFIIPARLLGQNAPSRRLNVACIGAGGQWRGHRDFILGNEQLQLTWVCDVDAEHAKDNVDKIQSHYAERNGTGSFKGVKSTGDFREALADPGVDLVWICTPDHWHALPAVLAAQTGRHFYIEKPLARTEAEGRAIVSAVRRAGVVAQVGCQQRSAGEFQRAIALARNGVLGKIRAVSAGLPRGGGDRGIKEIKPEPVPAGFDYKMWLGPTPEVPYMKKRIHWDWRWNYNYAGGQLTDWINHNFDIAQLALGVSGEAPVAIRNARAEFEDSALYNTATEYSFEAHYAGGEVIRVGTPSRGFQRGVRIEGDNGWLFVRRGRFECSNPAFRTMELPADGYVMPGGPGHDHRQNFLDAVLNRTTPRAPVRHAYYTALAAHLANAAFRAGLSELKWDAASGRPDSADAARHMAANYRGPWTLPAA